MDELKKLRERIDAIDTQLVELLHQRAEIVLQVREAKGRERADVYSPSREQQILERVRTLAKGGDFPEKSLDQVFAAIISATRSLVGELNIGFLAPEYSLCHQAALKQFGSAVKFVPLSSVSEVFQLTAGGDLSYGVVPAEDSAQGLRTETFASFLSSTLQVIAEVVLKERQHVHRHFVLGLRPAAPTAKDKTSLLVVARERAGALHELLRPFAAHGLTMTKIESKLIHDNTWEYAFAIDVLGNGADAPVKAALEEVAAQAAYLKVLGSYPAAE